MEQKPKKICPICGKEFEGYGNNPEPLNIKEKVCDRCNLEVIIPIRLLLSEKRK